MVSKNSGVYRFLCMSWVLTTITLRYRYIIYKYGTNYVTLIIIFQRCWGVPHKFDLLSQKYSLFTGDHSK